MSPSHPDTLTPPTWTCPSPSAGTPREAGITREEMDAWACGSHQPAIAAIDEGRFADEIVP